MAGGGKLKLRSTDSRFLAHADQWWRVLLPRMAPFLYKAGGPILMVQVMAQLFAKYSSSF